MYFRVLPRVLFVCLGDTPGGTKGLPLALSSEVSSGRLGRPYVMQEIKPSLAVCKANALAAAYHSALISLVLSYLFSSSLKGGKFLSCCLPVKQCFIPFNLKAILAK